MRVFYQLHYLRKVTRKLGLNPFLFNLFFGKKGYEQNFDNAFKNLLKPNMVIYDCGANIGHYTKEFAGIVGEKGIVYAIEPSELNGQRLKNTCGDSKNIVLLKYAIGKEKSQLWIEQGNDDIGANSAIRINKPKAGNEIEMLTLTDLFLQFQIPDAIKIDIEGFELDALQGINLNQSEFKKISLIGIEIHSKLMEERGLIHPQATIEKILTDAGFSIQWTDFSHLIATR